MEQELKGYDVKILKRIVKYLRHYMPVVIISIIALLFATASELALPIILQRTVDNHILSHWVEVDELVGNSRLIGNRIFAQEIDAKKLKDLSADMPRYYVFPKSEIEDGILAALKEDFNLYESDDYAAILLDDVSRLDNSIQQAIQAHDRYGIFQASMLYLALLLAVLFFSFIQVYLMALTSQNVMKDIRKGLFRNLIHQSLAYLGTTPIGRLVSATTSDVETINELFTNVFTSFLKDFAILIGVFIALFYLDAQLAIITMVSILPVLIVTTVFRHYSRKAYRSLRRWISALNAFLSEHISGMSVVQMFVKEERVNKEFQDTNTSLLKAMLGEMYVFSIFRPIIDFLAATSMAVIIYYGAGLNNRGTLTLGVLIAFLNLIEKFYRPIKDLSEKFNIMQSAMAGGERVFHFMDVQEAVPDNGTKDLSLDSKGSIVLKDVWFEYKKDEPVLKGLDLTVNPGERIAIVGYTGAGKTTITNLITRLWDIQSGSILLDGEPIQNIPIKTLRTYIQPVIQDVFLFSGTVRENIALGRTLSETEVIAAAKTVYAHDFVMKMKNGYDTKLNEGASNISAGERQLLSFARVIAHNPRIILLDEATANIDTETEFYIQKALDKLLEGRTSIVIAHRLSTIRTADRIVVLNEGKLVEQGTHTELLERKSFYYNLYKLQYSDSKNAV